MRAPWQIDFVADGPEDAPLLRIQGNDLQSARELYHGIRAMRDSMGGSVNAHQLPGIVLIGDITLRLKYFDQYLGIRRLGAGNDFECQLSWDGCQHVEDMRAPFCNRYSSRSGFQWLDETRDIPLLFSSDGGW
jgi:hypothetical protein